MYFNILREGKGMNDKEIWKSYEFKLQPKSKLNEDVFEFWEKSKEKENMMDQKR